MTKRSQPETLSGSGLPRPRLACVRMICVTTFVALCLVRAVQLPSAMSGQNGLDFAIVGFGLAATATIQEIRLPVQNWLASMVLAGVMAAVVEGWISDVPESRLTWLVPMWIVSLFTARGATRRLLRPWRQNSGYGFWLIGITGLLASLFVSLLQAAGQSAPVFGWRDFVVRSCAGYAILITIASLLVSKLPTAETVDWESSVCWLGLNALLIGPAMFQHRWEVLGAALVMAATVTLLSFRSSAR